MTVDERGTQSSEDTDIRQIPAWTRRYAQNRALPVAVAVGINTVLFLALASLSLVGGQAYRAENTWLLAVVVPALVVVLAVVIWTAIPRWGGLWIQQVGQRHVDVSGAGSAGRR